MKIKQLEIERIYITPNGTLIQAEEDNKQLVYPKEIQINMPNGEVVDIDDLIEVWEKRKEVI